MKITFKKHENKPKRSMIEGESLKENPYLNRFFHIKINSEVFTFYCRNLDVLKYKSILFYLRKFGTRIPYKFFYIPGV